MNRRQFCKLVGGVAAGATTAAGTVTATETTSTSTEEPPVNGMVSTLGHFAETDDGVELTEGHTATDYELHGSIPGYDGGGNQNHLLIPVHGVIDTADVPKAREWSVEVGTNLREAGYGGPVVGFAYSSSDDVFEALADAWSWDHPQREINRRSAYKLAAFVKQYARRAPETKIHLVGHSGGGFVVLEALKHLRETDWDDKLASVILLGAGVDDEMVAVDGRYGPAIQSHAVAVDSFYDPDDLMMDVGYTILRFDKALGAHEVQGTPPDNLETHNVDWIDGHDAYYRPKPDGAAEDILAQL